MVERELMAAMITIFDGGRYDIDGDRKTLHTGTAAYLEMIGAVIQPDTRRTVAASAVDRDGKYRLQPEDS